MKSILTFLIVTAIAFAFGIAAGSQTIAVGNYSAYFLCVVLAMVINWVAFVPSAIAKSDTFYDTTGAITYFTVTVAACFMAYSHHGAIDLRSLAIAAMVVIWCARLGTFLFIRIHAMGGTDSRFEKIKVNPARFLVAWTLQGLWVVLTASAAHVAILAQTRAPIGLYFFIGAAVWLFGFVWESVADAQKSAFKKDPANKGKFINVGLWRWSRHPNYFGEITLWTGVLIAAIPVLSGLSWLVVISPIFITLLLTKVSGVNLQKQQALERWGDDPDYREYLANTPMLVPQPPKLG
ncbi:MAG: DUF1295 domain-containing protein [Erythrobacter sp.]|uniref:DUF1295 domain-containing protein n=1 Tax=Erythrobacter sp. TaxID=1042 RepID=UPI00262719ED|nr:DUF1295 domain-containing protein [Erythrobacter sp.]MDJ0978837.1 DUF1295 domain-containing protein [Erythrobacter sp.]